MQELASQFTISDRALNALIETRRLERVQGMLTEPFVRRYIIDGTKIASAKTDFMRDASMRATEVNVNAQAIPDETLLALVNRLYSSQLTMTGALLKVNDLPWWKAAWLRLRGKNLAEVEFG